MSIKSLNSNLQLFREESGHEKDNAQRNLSGRTHYVDNDTLRFFDSRINRTFILNQGLLFGLIESVKHPAHGRFFRPVIFDVFGDVVARPEIEDCPKSSDPAVKMFWRLANNLDAVQITIEAIDRECGKLERRYNELVQSQQLLRNLEI